MSVRRLDAVVQAFVLAMLDPWGQVSLRGTVRPQLVRDDHPWLAPSFEEFPEKAHRGRLVSVGLDQNVQHIAVGIDSSPEPMFASLDQHHDLVEMPFVGRARPIPSDLRCELGTETYHPVTNRFVGNLDASRCQQIFNVTQTESEAVVRSNRVANDCARESKFLEAEKIRQIQNSSALQRQFGSINLTMPPILIIRLADADGRTGTLVRLVDVISERTGRAFRPGLS